MNYGLRGVGAALLFGLWQISVAETQVTDATILEVTERGFVLKVGTEPLAVEDESTTRFWRDKAPADKTAFKAGDVVNVRLRTDAAPTVLREMADRPTAEWLKKIRSEPVEGTVKKVDAKTVTIALADGSTFTYRATERSDVVLKGAKASATDLREGQKVWAKGRTLPSLDTWLVTLTDQPIVVASKTKTKKGNSTRVKVVKLAKEGILLGIVGRHTVPYRLFDLTVKDRMYHIMYTPQTAFWLGGRQVVPASLQTGMTCQAKYRRDGFGRIIATKVELSVGPTT